MPHIRRLLVLGLMFVVACVCIYNGETMTDTEVRESFLRFSVLNAVGAGLMGTVAIWSEPPDADRK